MERENQTEISRNKRTTFGGTTFPFQPVGKFHLQKIYTLLSFCLFRFHVSVFIYQ